MPARPVDSAPVATGEELRDAMRRHAAGIAVLTLEHEGRHLGVTVGSLVSLALEPPLVGVSMGHHSPLHTPLLEAGRFSLSLLAGDQAHVAQHFARGGVPPLALWAGIAVREGAGDRLLEGALAWLALRCRGRARGRRPHACRRRRSRDRARPPRPSTRLHRGRVPAGLMAGGI